MPLPKPDREGRARSSLVVRATSSAVQRSDGDVRPVACLASASILQGPTHCRANGAGSRGPGSRGDAHRCEAGSGYVCAGEEERRSGRRRICKPFSPCTVPGVFQRGDRRGDSDDGDDDPPRAGAKPSRRRERWAQEETMPAEKNPPWAICSANLNPRTTLDAGSFLSVQSIQSLVLRPLLLVVSSSIVTVSHRPPRSTTTRRHLTSA
jgi:hypothetical protein